MAHVPFYFPPYLSSLSQYEHWWTAMKVRKFKLYAVNICAIIAICMGTTMHGISMEYCAHL